MSLGAHSLLAALLALVIGTACGSSTRKPTVPPSDPFFNRFEAPSFKNGCGHDSDCVVGGCGSEVCAAEPVVTTCELLSAHPAGSCGCVDGTCEWFTDGG
jgi:eight-cysteine-cluster-containing protein